MEISLDSVAFCSCIYFFLSASRYQSYLLRNNYVNCPRNMDYHYLEVIQTQFTLICDFQTYCCTQDVCFVPTNRLNWALKGGSYTPCLYNCADLLDYPFRVEYAAQTDGV